MQLRSSFRFEFLKWLRRDFGVLKRRFSFGERWVWRLVADLRLGEERSEGTEALRHEGTEGWDWEGSWLLAACDGLGVICFVEFEVGPPPTSPARSPPPQARGRWDWEADWEAELSRDAARGRRVGRRIADAARRRSAVLFVLSAATCARVSIAMSFAPVWC